MTYYKVKKEYDNKVITKRTKSGVLKYSGFLVGNELYTQKEYDKLTAQSVNNIDSCFIPVNINPKNTYFFFGARFSK